MSVQPASAAELDGLLLQLQRELGSRGAPPAVVLREFVSRHHLHRDQLDDLAAMLSSGNQNGGRHQHHAARETLPSATSGGVYVARHSDESKHVQPEVAQSEPAPPSDPPELTSEQDFVEYDEFGLPVSAPAAAARPATGDVTERCVNDLMDDWQRQGSLSLTDIHRLADKLGLNASQIAQVVSRLEDVGAYDPDAEKAGTGRINDLDDLSYAGTDSVRAYLREISRYRLVRVEEEVELGRRIRAGQSATTQLESSPDVANHRYLRRLVVDGRAAHSELVCANLRLAVNMARHPRYRVSSVEFLDRIQFGNLGLIRAADKYDFSLGFKFSTYATWWIRQSMERGIADEGRLIRLPVHMVEKLNRLKRVRAELSDALNRPATVRELADHLGEDPGSVAALLDSEKMVTSLDAGLGEGDEFTLLDVIEDGFLDVDPADEVTASITTAQMHSLLLKVLTDREYKIINERFGLVDGDKRTLDEIGADLGVTRERVRQIEKKMLVRLRGPAGDTIRDLISVDGQRPVRVALTGGAPVSSDDDAPESVSVPEMPIDESNEGSKAS